MRVETLVVGPLQANCYVVAAPTGEGIVIDPGEEADRVLETIERLNLRILHILNTHGHFDHVGAVREVKEKTGAPFRIHRDERELLAQARAAAMAFAGLQVEQPPEADEYFSDGALFEAGSLRLQAIHTPGHSPGGVCFLARELREDGSVAEEALFSGDTLFAGSIGRTDLPGGSYGTLMRSVRERLLVLDDSLAVYPGHGPATTLGRERRSNPFLRGI